VRTPQDTEALLQVALMVPHHFGLKASFSYFASQNWNSGTYTYINDVLAPLHRR
jgi:hypothetical protein